MNLEEAKYNLTRLTRKQRAVLLADAVLWSLAIFFVVFVFTSLLTNAISLKAGLAGLGAFITFLIRGYRVEVFAFSEKNIVKLINRHYKEYEESADLLMDHGGLSTLQQIQQLRTLSEFNKSQGQFRFPNKLIQAIVAFAAGILISIGIFIFIPSMVGNQTPNSNTIGPRSIEAKLPAALKSVRLKVTPPPYTGLKGYTSEKLNLSVPEASTIQWVVSFSDDVQHAGLRLTGLDSLVLSLSHDGSSSCQRSCTESFIYQITWKDDQGNLFTSDYYKVEVLKDQAPQIAIENFAQFSELSMQDSHVIPLRSTLADDYGLARAHIIATVSKGSGEAIKFREEKLFFSTPETFKGKSIQAARAIDLKKLGMEPGDELYFYIEAFDTKSPAPNRSRTETYFIALQDSSSNEISVDAGLGVDLMPEYFRSQRQIIIDTEKLLRNKKKITTRQFKSTSNELGYDQKVLRLKYGEFLGEEFESGIGIQAQQGEAAETIEDAVKQYGHTHDTENEHNLVEDKKPAQKEDHHEHHEEGKEESPLEAFAHNHDNAEEATFFVLSVKAKLKAALAVMWDAELYLRVYEPEKSLPFQYQALRLLKEISNDSRVYVHRTGFDPPPIKEESRLKGDLSETKSTRDIYNSDQPKDFPAIRKALVSIEAMIANQKFILSPSDRTLFQQAGNELSGVAVEKPGVYLTSLTVLQDLIKGNTPIEKIPHSLLELRKTMWRVVPNQPSSPDADEQLLHDLDRQFIKNLTYD